MMSSQSNSEQSDSVHYREVAEKLRELAFEFRFPGTRKKLLDLALRYERRADGLDGRSGASSAQSQP
jgi:hypothetical protein